MHDFGFIGEDDEALAAAALTKRSLVPGLALDAGHAAAEQFRRLTESLNVDVGSSCLKFTISAGVAAYQTTDKNLDGLLERADHALYRAKELGRNRVETAV